MIAREWITYSMTYLPDLNSTPIMSIDPFDPKPLIDAYLGLTDCSETVITNCKDPAVAAEITDNFVQELQLPITTDFLPFLPSTVFTRPDLGRRVLAQATMQLWEMIGIFQNVEIMARWINAKEHNVFKDTPPTGNTEARNQLLDFIHFTYWRNIPPGVDRLTSFLSAWSVTLFQIQADTNDRTYIFLSDLLTPTQELRDGEWANFANDTSNLDWTNPSQGQYSLEIQNALAGGATRTFGV